MSRTLTGWNFWGTRGSRGTEAPARQPGTRVNPLQRAGPIRVRAEIPSVTRKRAFLNHADIPSDQQVQRFAREAVLILGEEPGVLDLPNHRPFLPILDPPTAPGLVPEFAPAEHLVDTLSVGTVGSQPRNLTPAPTSLAMERSCDHAGSLEPTGEIAGDLADELLVAHGQAAQETGLASVPFVEGQPLEVDAAAHGAVQQFQGDLPLGPVADRLRDAGLAAPLSVRRPVLRQEQLAVEQAVELAAGVAQVDGHHAVLFLADGAAPLPFHPRRLVPFLDVASVRRKTTLSPEPQAERW